MADADYEEGANGPLFCSFEAALPDDFPGSVEVQALTAEGVKVTHNLGVIDWEEVETESTGRWGQGCEA